MLLACTALYSMTAGVNVGQNAGQRGRAFELAVGGELVQQPGQVFYWRERNDEVDFVYQYRHALYAIEVKSGRKRSAKGLAAFGAQVPQALRVIIAPENFAQFFGSPRWRAPCLLPMCWVSSKKRVSALSWFGPFRSG